MNDDDTEIERRCAFCLCRVDQVRLRFGDGEPEQDDYCSAVCEAAWMDWWIKARSVEVTS